MNSALRINLKVSKVLVSFFSKVKQAKNNCWEWKGAIQSCGYGVMQIDKKIYKAHRLSYQIHKGKPDPKLVLDHICMNRKCVNPKHLRQVTQAQNVLENSNSASAINKRKTHCIRGHKLDGFYMNKGQKKRRCNTCHQNYMKKYHSAKLQEEK